MSTPPGGGLDDPIGDFVGALTEFPKVVENVVEAAPVVAQHIVEDAPFRAQGEYDGSTHAPAQLPDNNREHDLAYVGGYVDGLKQPLDPFAVPHDVFTPNSGPTMGPNTMTPDQERQGEEWGERLKEIRHGTAWGEHEGGHQPHLPDENDYRPEDPIPEPSVQME